MLEDKLIEEKDFSFSTKSILPVSFFLLAFSIMNFHEVSFPAAVQCSALLTFVASCLWGFKGLFFSTAFSCLLFLWTRSTVFSNFPLFVFFLIMVNTGVIVSLFKKMWMVSQKNKADELFRLKAWESHYYTFRMQCLEELAEVKNAQEGFFFVEQELQSLEKERIEEHLEEDSSQKILLDLFTASQKKSLDLQSEVEILEEILLKASKPLVKKRAPRKKKVQEPDGQRTFL